ncbi:MAG TPA: prepilin-type N-terminal cleavage/methylation domain-containing protein [Anaeromyxobacter sp.]
MAHPRSQRGFTLVETMVTVGIIAALATMAIPAFQKYTLRAKASERAAIMLRIKQAVQDYYVRNGTTVPGGGILDSEFNPPLPPIPAKRILRTDLAAWNTYFSAPGGGSSLPHEIGGGVYYSYRFVVDGTPTGGSITIWAAGDLDGDGVISYKRLVFTRVNGEYQPDASQEHPPAGQEDDSGPYATF